MIASDIGWNWLMSSAPINTISWLAGIVRAGCASRGKRSETFVTAGLGGHWAVISTSATGKEMTSPSKASQLVPQSQLPQARATARAKWLAGRPSCCPSPISTSCSRFRSRSAASRFRIRTPIYNILLQAASETLLTIAAEPFMKGFDIIRTHGRSWWNPFSVTRDSWASSTCAGCDTRQDCSRRTRRRECHVRRRSKSNPASGAHCIRCRGQRPRCQR